MFEHMRYHDLSVSKLKHLRYLDLSASNLKDVHADSIHQLYNLQTLILYRSENVHCILIEGIGSLINLRHLDLSSSDANLLPDSITLLTALQTLNIMNCWGIHVLPTNIGHLQNLSSLDISETNISELPDSISLLHNLTKLNFTYCNRLEALPLNFGALTQLRSLDFEYTRITELPESLTSNICKLEYVNLSHCEFPRDIKNWVELRILKHQEGSGNSRVYRGLKNLIRLELLDPYTVRNEEDVFGDNSSSSSIHELADLNSLRRLVIVDLQNVRGGKIEAERAKLKDKQNIQNLKLQWKSKEEEEEEVAVNNSVKVLEGLQPHPNLQELSIRGYPGLTTPKWMGLSSCLPNLVELEFCFCKFCTNIAGLGELPCLRVLELERLNSVKCLGKEFYYQQDEAEECKGPATATTTTRTFPCLTTLRVVLLENLEEWFAPDNSFPCLEEVEIRTCGNLTPIPDLRLWTSSLTKLTIRYCKKLEKKPMRYYFNKYLPSVIIQLE